MYYLQSTVIKTDENQEIKHLILFMVYFGVRSRDSLTFSSQKKRKEFSVRNKTERRLTYARGLIENVN